MKATLWMSFVSCFLCALQFSQSTTSFRSANAARSMLTTYLASPEPSASELASRDKLDAGKSRAILSLKLDSRSSSYFLKFDFGEAADSARTVLKGRLLEEESVLELRRDLNVYHTESVVLTPRSNAGQKQYKKLDHPLESTTYSTSYHRVGDGNSRSAGAFKDVEASITFKPDGSFSGSFHDKVSRELHSFSSLGANRYNRMLDETDFAEDVIKYTEYEVEFTKVHGAENPFPRKLQEQLDDGVSRFKDCYPDDSSYRFLDIGVASDYSYFLSSGSEADAIKTIEEFVTSTNVVFSSQFNLFIRIKQIILIPDLSLLSPSGKEDASDTEAIRQFFRASRSDQILPDGEVRYDCVESSSVLLEDHFRGWVAAIDEDGDSDEEPVPQGLWHLLTVCYQTGAVGAAFTSVGDEIGTLCETGGENAGVTSITGRGFVTFAHEIGHNMGAGHSFENGVGKELILVQCVCFTCSCDREYWWDHGQWERDFQCNSSVPPTATR